MRDFLRAPDAAQDRKSATGTASAPLTARLRLLATTDIHLQLTGYDFVTDQALSHHGLAGLATLIDAARAEARAEHRLCLLFDNGDLLQGCAMGGWLAGNPVTTSHPVVATINAMGYDAIGIGNHDLDFGLDYLRQVAGCLRPAMLASNLEGPGTEPLLRHTMFSFAIPHGPRAVAATLRVGVLSVLPTLTNVWNRENLPDANHAGPAADCLRVAVPRLRAQGADVVVVLAHMGLPEDSEIPSYAEDDALTLAAIPGIDALILGHTHRRFPAAGRHMARAANNRVGALGRIPAMMPGYAGSDLGVLDLTLARAPGMPWKVVAHRSALRANGPGTPPAPAILRATEQSRAKFRTHLAQPVGHIDRPLHNFFSRAAPTSTGAFCADAKARIVRTALRGTRYEGLPLLATASAHSAGGRDGPDHYLEVPQGTVLRRHLAGLDPYGNRIWALQVSGRTLRRHLEHAARAFEQLSPDTPDQPLLRADTPSFNFDSIHGLRYLIDPTRAPGERITLLQHADAPVRDTDRFILVTNQFRAAAGGGYDRLPEADIVLRHADPAETAFIAALEEPGATVFGPDPPWSFAPSLGVSTILETSPKASAYLADLAPLRPQDAGQTTKGFARFRLSL